MVVVIMNLDLYSRQSADKSILRDKKKYIDMTADVPKIWELIFGFPSLRAHLS